MVAESKTTWVSWGRSWKTSIFVKKGIQKSQRDPELTFVDLILKSTRQHLIGLIEAENLDMVGPEGPTVDHIEHTSRSTDDNLDTLLELGHVLTDVGSTNASMALNVHVVAKGDHNFLNLLSQLTGGGKDEGLGALNRHIQL